MHVAEPRPSAVPGAGEPPAGAGPGAPPASTRAGWITSVDEAPEHWLRRVREAGTENEVLVPHPVPQETGGLAEQIPPSAVGAQNEDRAKPGVASSARTAARSLPPSGGAHVSALNARPAPGSKLRPRGDSVITHGSAGTSAAAQGGAVEIGTVENDGSRKGGPPPDTADRAAPGTPPRSPEPAHDLPPAVPVRQWPRGPAVARLRLGAAQARLAAGAADESDAPAGPAALPDTGRSRALADAARPAHAPAEGAPTGPAASAVGDRLVLRAPHPLADPGGQRPIGVHRSTAVATDTDLPERPAPGAPGRSHARGPNLPVHPPSRVGPPASPAEPPPPVRSGGPAPTPVAAASPHPWPELNVPRPPQDDGPSAADLARVLARSRRLAREESRV